MTAHCHPDPLRLTGITARVVLAALNAAPDGDKRYVACLDSHSAEAAAAVALGMSGGGVIDCTDCLLEVLVGAVAMLADYIHDGDPDRYEAALDDATRTAAAFIDMSAVQG